MTIRSQAPSRFASSLCWAAALLLASFGPACATSSSAATSEPPVPPATDAGDASLDVFQDAADAQDAAEEPEAGSVCVPDEDLDGIPDEVEGKAANVDTDGDGTPDYLDDESDDDGIPDAIEGDVHNAGCLTPQDSDGDGTPDFRDTDSDDNGIPDELEVYPDGTPYDPAKGAADTDGDGWPDYADPDNDGDGLPDSVEATGHDAVDTDHDGTPDLDDIDSDDDTIADGNEGANDVDHDGIPNFRDLDSDGDGVPDECESGLGHVITMLPDDTDSDGKYDFLDVDTDGDGLLDSEEDKNGNCAWDVADAETDRLYQDSDSDGHSDLIEVTLGSDPNDLWSTPQSVGKFYFLVPYELDADPPEQLVPVDTGLQRADVGFFVDTTGTMGGEIDTLRNGLMSIVPKLKAEVPDVGIGVAAHDDYPVAPYGVAGQDQPFYLPTPQGQVSVNADDALSALQAITLHNGSDDPESQVAGMHRGLTNLPLQWPGNIMQADNVPVDRMGSLAFRKSGLPILVEITDAPFHNGRRATAPSVLHDAYSFNSQSPYPAPTVDTLVSAMDAVGARVIGISSDDGVRSGDPYDDLAWLSDATGSLVPPSAFGGSTCNTALAGLPLNVPDGPGGTCRLVFDIAKNGVGLTDRVVDAVKALVRSLVMDVRVIAVPDEPSLANGWIDSVDLFVDSVEVSTSGGDDPMNPTDPCVILPIQKVLDAWDGPKGQSPGGDTYWDTVLDAKASTKICYVLRVKPNSTIEPAAKIQVFHAALQVRARNGNSPVELDFGPPRDVLFLVPALPQ